MNTPCRTPRSKLAGAFGVPMFIPPTPMLQNLGYGTGVAVYRIERSPLRGCLRSPWALKRVTRRAAADNQEAAATYKQRLTDEADILRRLDHPNIVGFRGMLAPDGRASLAMEMCDTSLGDLLEQRHEQQLELGSGGPLPAAHILRMSLDVCRALDYLHTNVRLLHGDLKSYNVLVKADFAVCKLCDFGVSLPLDADGYVDVQSRPDAQYVGTALWCAPEALLDDNVRNVSDRSDVFSFGLVIFECVALVPPHTNNMTDGGDEDGELEEGVDEEHGDDEEEEEEEEELYGTRPPLPESVELGDEYNVVVELFFVCTNAEPDDRPSAGELVKLLDTR